MAGTEGPGSSRHVKGTHKLVKWQAPDRFTSEEKINRNLAFDPRSRIAVVQLCQSMLTNSKHQAASLQDPLLACRSARGAVPASNDEMEAVPSAELAQQW